MADDRLTEEPAGSELIGTILDNRYEVVEALGAGGMGSVFRGKHVVVGRQVAIKTLADSLTDAKDFHKRFQREAIAAGRLTHPNCVPVTDSGRLPDGGAYLVMELVEGKSLGSLLKEHPRGLAPMRALRILRHVLRGLGHAHSAGIVHRDIKPDNIMLCAREGDEDFARILDFGIAKIRDAEQAGTENITQSGVAIGTPSYLSPEQALGDTIDARSDLYSCTAMLFELLTGAPPFRADSLIGVLTKHASADPPALSERNAELGRWPQLNDICQKGLAKEREHRFQSADEFVEAVDLASHYLLSPTTPPPGSLAPLATPPAGISVISERAPSMADSQLEGPIGTPSGSAGRPDASATGPINIARAETAQTAPNPLPRSIKGPRRRRLLWMGGAVVVAAIGVFLSIGSPGSSHRSSDALFQSNAKLLTEGETCEDRLNAVLGFRTLKDPRAIPLLRKARHRMRGGVIGIGASNENRCLKSLAQETIKELRAIESKSGR